MNRDDIPPSENPRKLDLACSVLGPAGAEPLLVIHGITASSRYWQPHLTRLAGRHRLLIPDLPGFGRSPKPFVDYTIGFFADALEGFLDRHAPGTKRLGLLGHSLGGLLALELVCRRPDGFSRIALLNLPRFTDPEAAHRVMLAGSSSYRSLLTVNTVSADWAQLRRNGWSTFWRLLHRLPWAVVSDSRRFTFRSLTSTLEHCLLHFSVDSLLARLPASLPLLLIHGDRDNVAPVAPVVELEGRPPHPTLHVVRGAGHNLFHTHPRECLPLLESFFAGAAPTPVASYESGT